MSGKIRMLIILKAAQEKTINFYGTLAQVNAEKILPVFEKRYPGVKLNHVDITSDSLVARATAEARGGKTLGDIFQAPLETAIQMNDQKLLLEVTLPEYSAYPAIMKGPYWVASNLQFIVVAWNTNLLKKADEPKWIDDLADAKYKGSLVAEPRDRISHGHRQAQVQKRREGDRFAARHRCQRRGVS